MSAPARRRAERRGRRAETAATVWLTLKGWRIIARRARTAAGEIDLIARRGRTLAFVEVKARSDRKAALESLSPRQRERITRAAALWRARSPRPAALDPRFDLVLVAPGRLPRHLPGVFAPEGAGASDLL
jgi:putative endonuclease